LAAAWAGPAAARPLPDGGMTADEVADWLHAAGYPATVKPDPTTPGDRIISSSIDGIDYDIYMYGCEHDRCNSLQYAAGWSGVTLPSDKILEWDRTKRYLRAYIGSGNAWWGEYDIDVYPGGTYEALGKSLQRWRDIITDFKTYIGR
jgi:hypothetical protein